MGLRQWLDRLWGKIPADPVGSVQTNAGGLVIRLQDETHTVPWERVKSIAIQHVPGSDPLESTHYLFSLGSRDLRISEDTPGMRGFLERLQKVPGLRHHDYLDAMRFGNEFPVVIWRNPTLDASPEHREHEDNTQRGRFT